MPAKPEIGGGGLNEYQYVAHYVLLGEFILEVQWS
jgi:hypothetical protein